MIIASEIKSYLERVFSMPFDIRTEMSDGETHFICNPHNEDNIFFEIKAYIHSSIRLIIDIYPQKHGGYILTDMANASEEKKNLFFSYLQYMIDDGAKVKFLVNNTALENILEWPDSWRNFHCKITKVPIPESDNADFDCIKNWLELSFNLMFSLLNIVDTFDSELLPIQSEGTPTEIKSIRYERNEVNRKICIKRKGYTCCVCGLNFEQTYGNIGKGFVEIHHTTPVSQMGSDYILNIDRDLVPICSNCHSMAHRSNPPLPISKLKELYQELNLGSDSIAAEPYSAYSQVGVNNLIIGVVKPDRVAQFVNFKAKSYYFGRRFPSTFNLKNIQYFAPYFNSGILGYYDVLGIRTATKSEIDSNSLGDINDTRIILDLGNYHYLSDEPIKVKLIHHNYAILNLNKLLKKD